MLKNQIDCIIRIHDINRLRELDRCIFSLFGQVYRPIHVIIVTQRFTQVELKKLNDHLEYFGDLYHPLAITIKNYEDDKPTDARSQLLNLGISCATGQYLAFLDYDDVLYPEAYSILINQFKNNPKAAIVFAKVRLVKVNVFKEYLYISGLQKANFSGVNLYDLFCANFCPIHSFMIDRSKIDSDLVYFDTNIAWEEDYNFLLKICATYPSDFTAIKIEIGDYYFKDDGSNTIPFDGVLSEEMKEKYAYIQEYISKTKSNTFVSCDVIAQLGIFNHNIPITINDVVREKF